MGVMMRAASRSDIMGTFAVHGPIKWFEWTAAACMLLAVAAMLVGAVIPLR